MALLSQADVEARLGRSLTSEEATAFTVINASVQAYIEKMLNTGVESVSATTRYYDGGVQHLEIDPCTSLTALKYVDDDQVVEYTFDTSDYTVEPVNRTLKTMVRNRDGKFGNGINNVSVTAKFSIYEDTGTLNIVKNAMLEAITDIINGKDRIESESIEGYSVRYLDKESAHIKALKTVIQRII